MALLRKIPFGYKMESGVIVPHTEEAGAVVFIFGRYLQGESLQAIADTMSNQSIRYHEASSGWNKNMVNRILESPKYIGQDEYPAILPIDIWNDAQKVRGMKTVGVRTQPLCVESIKRRFYCGECGAAISKKTFIKYNKRWWHCSNPECSVIFNLRDDTLEEALTALLNRLITSPELLGTREPAEQPVSLEAARIQNEINRELNKADINIEYLTALIFSCAAEKYTVLDDGAEQRRIAELKADLHRRPLLTTFDPALFNETVETVLVKTDKTFALRTVGGNIIS